MDISLALRKVRFEKGMKQGTAAKKAKVTASYLSQVESGKRQPSPGLLTKLCKVYGVPHIVFTWIATEEKDIAPNKKAIFRELKPAVDSLINEILK